MNAAHATTSVARTVFRLRLSAKDESMSEIVQHRDMKRTRGNVTLQHSALVRETTPATHIMTLVDPALRSKIDLVSSTKYAPVHLNTVEAVYEVARSFVVGALLVSPELVLHSHTGALRELLRKCPGISPIAVIGTKASEVDDGLLRLGACGFRSVIDISDPRGLKALRNIDPNPSADVTARILETLLPVLSDASSEAIQFFVQLIRSAPTTNSIKAFALQVHTNASTITSRFFRASLPSPRTYLAQIRLLYVANYLSNPSVTVSTVSTHLGYSSPAALHRHLRTTCGITPRDLRIRGFQSLLKEVARNLFARYRKELCTFMQTEAATHQVDSL